MVTNFLLNCSVFVSVLIHPTTLKELINPEIIPQHIAVIMDGNGRWAKQQGEKRIFGHQNAINAVRETTEGCVELGVKYLTLYAFSTENWGRPQDEVNALMELLVRTIHHEMDTLTKNRVKLNAIGDIAGLPESCRKELRAAMQETAHYDRMTLTLALNYSGRWEIIEAVKKIAAMVQHQRITPEQISSDLFASCLNTANMPDPELLIRTSGEMRISNYLLWQIAYTELHITPTLWPDFRREHLHQAILDYQKRERRFGKTSEQIKC
jgi:undecaprenyl diphosphate synthase